jgi:hypothetical protein
MLALLGVRILALLALVFVAYSIPVFIGFEDPIAMPIFVLALYLAWIMNRAAELIVSGPYRIRRSGIA